MCGQQHWCWHNRRTVRLYVCCAVGANESVGLAGPIKMSGGRGVLLVVGAALAMAEGTAGVGSASGADTATIAAPEALGPGVYDGAGGGGA